MNGMDVYVSRKRNIGFNQNMNRAVYCGNKKDGVDEL